MFVGGHIVLIKPLSFSQIPPLFGCLENLSSEVIFLIISHFIHAYTEYFAHQSFTVSSFQKKSCTVDVMSYVTVVTVQNK